MDIDQYNSSATIFLWHRPVHSRRLYHRHQAVVYV